MNFQNTIYSVKKGLITTIYCDYETMAGETRVEHATDGFGDRCSTIELLPYDNKDYILKIGFSQHIFYK